RGLMSEIQQRLAGKPLVLSIDVGTSSARAILYDALGRAVEGAQGRAAYLMTTTPDGGVEMDPNQLLDLTVGAIDAAANAAGSLMNGVCSVAMCTFWHSVMGVDTDGRPVTPLYNWSDSRSREDARDLGRRFGTARIHSLTGAMPHSSYYPAKILWLRRTQPSLYGQIARWVSFGEYFYWRLFGRWLCSVSIASGTGLFNPNTCNWEREILDAVGLGHQHLSPLGAQAECLTGLTRQYSQRCQKLSSTPC